MFIFADTLGKHIFLIHNFYYKCWVYYIFSQMSPLSGYNYFIFTSTYCLFYLKYDSEKKQKLGDSNYIFTWFGH